MDIPSDAVGLVLESNFNRSITNIPVGWSMFGKGHYTCPNCLKGEA